MKVRPESWFAAAVVAVLTITVFDRLQDFGPTSAVRRFHNAIITRNLTELRRVTVEPADSKHLYRLEGQVERELSLSTRYEVARMDLAGDEVRAAVVYYDGNGRPTAFVFVLERDGRAWRVNAEKTNYVQDMLFLPHA